MGVSRSYTLLLRHGLKRGKENDVTDAANTCKHDDQTVDPNAHATGRWHTMLKGEQEFLVDLLLFLPGLTLELLPLDKGIILLGIRRSNFLAVDA